MKQLTISCPWRPLNVVFIGDIQWAGKRANSTALAHLQRIIGDALETDQEVRFIGMGDYIDFASPSNRARLKSANLYDTATDIIDDKALELTHELYDLALKPTKGKWLGLVEGHHLHELKEGTTTDMRLCEMLEAPFLGTTGLIKLSFCMGTSSSRKSIPVVVWVHHGTGSGQTGYYPLSRLEKVAAVWEQVDVFAMGHTCLPLRARILTRRGWKSFRDVLIGEDVLAYVEGRGEWTPLQNVTSFASAPLIRSQSKSFMLEATPEHQMVIVSPWNGAIRLDTLETAKGHERLVVAAPGPEAGDLESGRDASILGWLVTDGSLTWTSHGKFPDARIVQKKEPWLSAIRGLLGSDASEYRREAGQSEFYLRARFLRPFLARMGYRDKGDLAHVVPRLSGPARRAMLQAMLQAEGDGHTVFSQNPGPVLDAFYMLCALEGIRLGKTVFVYREGRTPWGRPVIGQVRRVKLLTSHGGPVQISALRREPIEPGPVWCPTTQYGTWVAELDGQVFITGNTKMCHEFMNKPYPRWSPAMDLSHRKVILIGTGGYSKTYVEGAMQGRVPRGGYAEQRMLSPSIIGSPVLHIRPRVREGYLSVDLTAEG